MMAWDYGETQEYGGGAHLAACLDDQFAHKR
jgi:hypothetical protein